MRCGQLSLISSHTVSLSILWLQGSYSDGAMHGNGVYHFGSGDVYEGTFVAGEKSGRGKYTSNTGSVYDGEYAKDKRHGKGTFRYPSGAVFEGIWDNDQVQGQQPQPSTALLGAKGRRASLFRSV